MVTPFSSSPRSSVRALFPDEGLAIRSARFLLVVPPFANADWPSIGAHIIARVATDRGFQGEVAYANLSFAAELGVRDYCRLCESSAAYLFGERIFSAAVYGDAASAELDEETAGVLRGFVSDTSMDLAALQALATQWSESYAEKLAATSAEIIGFTSTFEQTLASLALIERVRRHAPDKTLILGGANLDGDMASGVASLSDAVDHVFSGESEVSLARFLDARACGKASPRIIRGSANRALDEIPAPDYESYIRQLDQTVSASFVDGGLRREELWLPYESSRGCWWGAKHHCTFCGLNALGMGYREKDPDKVLNEIVGLAERYGGGIMMVDNIMPFSYFSTLIPQLASRRDGLRIFYEQKANLSFERMRMLAQAGVMRIQPGIESLDTTVLRLMRKGSTLRTNLACLRYGRIMKIVLAWNLLVDFPHDEDAAYEAMAALVPLLYHLEPPSAAAPLSIERFSPYFDDREAFGVENVRPVPAYAAAFPTLADTSLIAYHFQADYPSTYRRRPELIREIAAMVEAWRSSWADPEKVPMLEVFDLADGRYLICDTRPGATIQAEIITLPQARFCLTGVGGEQDAAWALDRGYAWRGDDQALPLAITTEDCMLRFMTD